MLPYFKSKDELLEDEFQQFLLVNQSKLTEDQGAAVLAMKYFFKAYSTDAVLRAIIDDKRFGEAEREPSLWRGRFARCAARVARRHSRVHQRLRFASTNSCKAIQGYRRWPNEKNNTMLDTDTKRRIDSCRDILVGKVPDPKSQVEQITIALIYKFMDDMDTQSEEFGGKRSSSSMASSSLVGAKLLAPSMGPRHAEPLLRGYWQDDREHAPARAVPRHIQNAYLPYRDPETLKAF